MGPRRRAGKIRVHESTPHAHGAKPGGAVADHEGRCEFCRQRQANREKRRAGVLGVGEEPQRHAQTVNPACTEGRDTLLRALVAKAELPGEVFKGGYCLSHLTAFVTNLLVGPFEEHEQHDAGRNDDPRGHALRVGRLRLPGETPQRVNTLFFSSS